MLNQPSEIKQAYAETSTAEEYIDTRFTSAWGAVVHSAQVRIINAAIRQFGVKRLLEIAPGPARLSRQVTGFDQGYLCEYNESMLQVARRRLSAVLSRWTIVRGDAFRLPFGKQPNLDMVYSFRFIRHFQDEDRSKLYGQVRSVLRDGGLFVFDAVNVKVGWPVRMREGLESYPIYDELYQPAELKRELEAHGFTPLTMTPVIRHMRLQHWIQVLVGPRWDALARWAIQTLERLPGQPLEWVVVCQKTA